MLEGRRDVLERREEARRIFTCPDGEPYRAGDHFRQPDLTEALHQVAEGGADHMYTGPRAKALVERDDEDKRSQLPVPTGRGLRFAGVGRTPGMMPVDEAWRSRRAGAPGLSGRVAEWPGAVLAVRGGEPRRLGSPMKFERGRIRGRRRASPRVRAGCQRSHFENPAGYARRRHTDPTP